MGRYFGLRNYTRHQQVSSYWKGYPPEVDEVIEIMRFLEWSTSDVIVSGCYDSWYIWKNNDWTDEWDCKVEDVPEWESYGWDQDSMTINDNFDGIFFFN